MTLKERNVLFFGKGSECVIGLLYIGQSSSRCLLLPFRGVAVSVKDDTLMLYISILNKFSFLFRITNPSLLYTSTLLYVIGDKSGLEKTPPASKTTI